MITTVIFDIGNVLADLSGRSIIAASDLRRKFLSGLQRPR